MYEQELLYEEIAKLKKADADFKNSYSSLCLLSLDIQPCSPLTEADFDFEEFHAGRNSIANDQALEREAQEDSQDQYTEDETVDPLELCLALNRKSQLWISQALAKINAVLDVNKKHQENIKNEISDLPEEQQGTIKRRNITFFSFPYFKELQGSFPRPNALTMKKNEAGFIDSNIEPLKPWDEKEQETLVRSVKAERLQKLLRPHLSRKQIEYEKYENAIDGSKEHFESLKNLRKIEVAIKKIQECTDTKIIFGNLDDDQDVDWMKIANVDLKGEKSADYCQQFWKVEGHPLINKSDWTSNEDARLVELAEEFKKRRWKDIAEQLGTNRTAFQCFIRYQTIFNPLIHSKWTATEDRLLEKSVNRYAKKYKEIPWSQVSKAVTTKSPELCQFRWEQTELKFYSRTRWTRKQDIELERAVALYGPNWVKVSSMMSDKNSNQCRERWSNGLNKTFISGHWSKKEDEILRKAILEDNLVGQWAKISREHLVGRSDNQIYGRYKRLFMGGSSRKRPRQKAVPKEDSDETDVSDCTEILSEDERVSKIPRLDSDLTDDSNLQPPVRSKPSVSVARPPKLVPTTLEVHEAVQSSAIAGAELPINVDDQTSTRAVVQAPTSVDNRPSPSEATSSTSDVNTVVQPATFTSSTSEATSSTSEATSLTSEAASLTSEANTVVRPATITSTTSKANTVVRPATITSTTSKANTVVQPPALSSSISKVHASTLPLCFVSLDSSFRNLNVLTQETETSDHEDFPDPQQVQTTDGERCLKGEQFKRESLRLDKEIAKMLFPLVRKENGSTKMRSYQMLKPDFKSGAEEKVTSSIDIGLKLSTQHVTASKPGEKPCINLPLLPPSSSSMNGFLKLLNERNHLVRTAQLFQFPRNHKFPLPWKRTKLENLVDSSRACDLFKLDDVCGEDDSESEALVHLQETLSSKDCTSNTEVVCRHSQASRLYRNTKSRPEYAFFESRFNSLFFWPLLLCFSKSSDTEGVSK